MRHADDAAIVAHTDAYDDAHDGTHDDAHDGTHAASHVVPLDACAASIEHSHGVTPRFDPRDGGVHARMLLLLESPAPSTATNRIVSRDNPSAAQRNLKRLLAEAGIDRCDTVLWNVVPWVVRHPGVPARALRSAEIAEGLRRLAPILDLLPHLRVAVLAGRQAQRASSLLRESRPNLAIFSMPHPSPLSLCTSPSVECSIRSVLAAAKTLLDRRDVDESASTS